VDYCASSAQCIVRGESNPCISRSCVDGTCVKTVAPDGPSKEQIPDDCNTAMCVGGSITQTPNDMDRPPSGPCDWVRCEGGKTLHGAMPDGTRCGAGTCFGGACSNSDAGDAADAAAETVDALGD